MDIVGADMGYSHTKTHARFACESRITTVEPLLGHRRTLDVDGKRYYVGTGNRTVEVNKVNEEITRVLLLYAIGSSTADTTVRVVTGLPIGQYREHKAALRDMVLSCRGPIVVDGVPRALRIEDCIVRPQGVLGNCLSVDIGGRTTDIAYVMGGDLVYAKTIYDGTIALSGRIMDVVNATFDLALPDDHAWSVLQKGLVIGDKAQDLSCVAPVLAEFADRLAAEITMSAAAVRPLLCGGGAKIMHQALQKRIPSCVLVPDAQFANALMYRKIGEQAWLS